MRDVEIVFLRHERVVVVAVVLQAVFTKLMPYHHIRQTVLGHVVALLVVAHIGVLVAVLATRPAQEVPSALRTPRGIAGAGQTGLVPGDAHAFRQGFGDGGGAFRAFSHFLTVLVRYGGIVLVLRPHLVDGVVFGIPVLEQLQEGAVVALAFLIVGEDAVAGLVPVAFIGLVEW